MWRHMKQVVAAAVLAVAILATPRPAQAHCDSLDGPVVQAAREALATGEVERVLIWVLAQDEDEIREAFQRVLEVRSEGEGARQLADLWFFETLVRIHRAGEGAPYTGLKPEGYTPPEGIVAADQALEEGSVDALVHGLGSAILTELEERFERAQALRDHDPTDVEAGRRYVHAYVDYMHMVEALHHLLHGAGGHGPQGSSDAAH